MNSLCFQFDGAQIPELVSQDIMKGWKENDIEERETSMHIWEYQHGSPTRYNFAYNSTGPFMPAEQAEDLITWDPTTGRPSSITASANIGALVVGWTGDGNIIGEFTPEQAQFWQTLRSRLSELGGHDYWPAVPEPTVAAGMAPPAAEPAP